MTIAMITAALFLIFDEHEDPAFLHTVFLGCALLILLGQTGIRQACLLGLGFPTLGLLPEKVLFPGFVVIGTLLFANFSTVTMSSFTAMSATALSALMALLIAQLILRNRLSGRIPTCPPRYRNGEWIASALPYSLLNVAQLSLAKTDIILLSLLDSPTESGKYAAASLLASLVVFFINAGNRVVSVEFSRLFVSNQLEKLQRLFTASSSVFLLLSLPVIVILVVFGADDTLLLRTALHRGI